MEYKNQVTLCTILGVDQAVCIDALHTFGVFQVASS